MLKPSQKSSRSSTPTSGLSAASAGASARTKSSPGTAAHPGSSSASAALKRLSRTRALLTTASKPFVLAGASRPSSATSTSTASAATATPAPTQSNPAAVPSSLSVHHLLATDFAIPGSTSYGSTVLLQTESRSSRIRAAQSCSDSTSRLTAAGSPSSFDLSLNAALTPNAKSAWSAPSSAQYSSSASIDSPADSMTPLTMSSSASSSNVFITQQSMNLLSQMQQKDTVGKVDIEFQGSSPFRPAHASPGWSHPSKKDQQPSAVAVPLSAAPPTAAAIPTALPTAAEDAKHTSSFSMRMLYEEALETMPAVVPVRSHAERDANPEKLNLNRKNLYVCPPLPFEDRLRLLNYQGNYITRIENMHNLHSLVFLDLYNNQIEGINGLDMLVNLRVLMLGKNRIKQIANLDMLVKLDVLDLHSNRISTIEHLSHLAALRILNLEDNAIERVPTLVGNNALGELNLKHNKIKVFDKNTHLDQLRRIVLSDNKITSIDDIAFLFDIPGLVELTMDQNKVASQDHYRALVVSRCKSVKLLDGRRVLEEERRSATRLAKREADRRREIERRSNQVEERKKCIAYIQQVWEREMSSTGNGGHDGGHDGQDSLLAAASASGTLGSTGRDAKHGNGRLARPNSSPTSRNKAFDGKSAYVELDDATLSIYGNGMAVLDRIDPQSITAIQFHLIQFARLDTAFTKLEKFAHLSSLTLGPTGLSSLKQIQPLTRFKHLVDLDISSENAITRLSLFRPFVVCMMADSLQRLCGSSVSEVARQESRSQFGHLKSLVQESARIAKPSGQPHEQIDARTYVRSLVDESIETNEKIRAINSLWSKLVVQTCVDGMTHTNDADAMMIDYLYALIPSPKPA
ncbi:hypothetical protein BC831DRAFT_469006 [Entophlyctis helioformis]|nr:hypothetical protein BC831DRAFT_469006 [Entophlyctis helioformis]